MKSDPRCFWPFSKHWLILSFRPILERCFCQSTLTRSFHYTRQMPLTSIAAIAYTSFLHTCRPYSSIQHTDHNYLTAEYFQICCDRSCLAIIARHEQRPMPFICWGVRVRKNGGHEAVSAVPGSHYWPLQGVPPDEVSNFAIQHHP